MRGFIGGLFVGLVAGVILAVTSDSKVGQAPSAEAPGAQGNGIPGSPVSWRMASVFPANMGLSGNTSRAIALRVSDLTGSNLNLTFHNPGAVVEGLDVFDAVSSGTIEAAFSSPSFWGSKSRAFELLGGIPFGPKTDEFLAWYHDGGGKKLAHALYQRHNIHGLICGLNGPVAGGIFRAHVSRIEDLRNKTISAAGLGARVLSRAGATTQLHTPQDALAKLKDEQLFGASFMTPLNIDPAVVTETAKHIYFPGWSQQFSTFDLLIHLRDWNGLHANAKAIIEAACAQNIVESLSHSEGQQFTHLKRLINRGAEIQRWPQGLTEKLKSLWQREARRLTGNDRDFRRMWESLQAFRRDYSIWQELGYL